MITLKEFCEKALSNDLIALVDDVINPQEQPEKVIACYWLLLDVHKDLEKEIERFSYGFVDCFPARPVLLVQLKK